MGIVALARRLRSPCWSWLRRLLTLLAAVVVISLIMLEF